MSDAIISVVGLGKKYRIRHQAEGRRYVALRDVIAEKFTGLFQNRKSEIGNRKSGEDFWALKDVSFEVKRGEVVGIIGRNGAGKSTLLKILSRITEPTEGEVRLRGRVASLLEVGTGFHPELTGRENVFLNGAILGMSKAEIKKKFDEIVAFAEIEKFLDTPVKRYSSGMYVRLAFAVAAHLEPEILIVDEVLAVGDAQFQKRCLGKMQDVATKEGRTVLLVSHNLAAVRTLCRRGMQFDTGRLVSNGGMEKCIEKFQNTFEEQSRTFWKRNSNHVSGIAFAEISTGLEGKQPTLKLVVECKFVSSESFKPSFLAIDVLDFIGTPIMQALPSVSPFIDSRNSNRRFRFEISLSGLVPGQYQLTLWIGPHHAETYDLIRNCVSFSIVDSPSIGRTFPHTTDHGFIVPRAEYSVLD